MLGRRVAAVMALVPVTLMSACGYGGALDDARREAEALPVVISVDQSNVPDGVTSYLEFRKSPENGGSTEGGVRVKSAEDLGKLHGASADFKSFLGWQLRANVAAVKLDFAERGMQTLPARCELAARITVWGVAPEVAMGREWWCNRDANEVIWVKQGDSWRIAGRMRGGWDCRVLEHYKVPPDITAAVCWEKDGRTVREYTGPGH